ncbi:MAG: Zn-dependent hydrolase [Prevotellaceae bacterium]|jgi:hypothetical protein|nr:Zn-dependent hydrolase [Prevotellaceae bacterium]
MKKYGIILFAILLTVIACKNSTQNNEKEELSMRNKVNEYVEVELTTDLSYLSDNERQMIPLLIEVARIMDDIFWTQASGKKEDILSNITDEAVKEYAIINYGPWDRMRANESFIEGIGVKPAGACFYPTDMTKEEFASLNDERKESQYTLIRRDENGKLIVVPYHIAYEEQIGRAAELLNKAAELADDKALKSYLTSRAQALLTDEYQKSDFAWMDMKTNNIDFVVGPIENYEDELYGYKAAHEAYVLVKDREWSSKLERFVALLPSLQKNLPVDGKYKKEMPGTDSDLNVYDAVYYAGDCNAAGKTIAINLPNDPEVQLQKGSRKLQLKNSMQYKFDHMVQPIAGILIDPAQRHHVKFDAFFENVMFHEVAHGLGVKKTITNGQDVRAALKEQYSAIEEAKADLLGIFIVGMLADMGVLPENEVMDNYVTFVAGIFRSVRFGASSAHGKANMLCFNFFEQEGAFTRGEEDGTYRVNFEEMKQVVEKLINRIITMQGDGNYEEALQVVTEQSIIKQTLANDLKRIEAASIPIDVRFKQGVSVLGLD